MTIKQEPTLDYSFVMDRLTLTTLTSYKVNNKWYTFLHLKDTYVTKEFITDALGVNILNESDIKPFVYQKYTKDILDIHEAIQYLKTHRYHYSVATFILTTDAISDHLKYINNL